MRIGPFARIGETTHQYYFFKDARQATVRENDRTTRLQH